MYFVKINLIINNWSYTVAFGVIINRLMTEVIKFIFKGNLSSVPYFLLNPNGFFYVSIVVFLIAVPLTLKKQLTGMSFFGVLTFIISLFNILILTYYASSNEYNHGNNAKDMKSFNTSGLSLTLPTAIFAYIC